MAPVRCAVADGSTHKKREYQTIFTVRFLCDICVYYRLYYRNIRGRLVRNRICVSSCYLRHHAGCGIMGAHFLLWKFRKIYDNECLDGSGFRVCHHTLVWQQRPNGGRSVYVRARIFHHDNPGRAHIRLSKMAGKYGVHRRSRLIESLCALMRLSIEDRNGNPFRFFADDVLCVADGLTRISFSGCASGRGCARRGQ